MTLLRTPNSVTNLAAGKPQERREPPSLGQAAPPAPPRDTLVLDGRQSQKEETLTTYRALLLEAEFDAYLQEILGESLSSEDLYARANEFAKAKKVSPEAQKTCAEEARGLRQKLPEKPSEVDTQKLRAALKKLASEEAYW